MRKKRLLLHRTAWTAEKRRVCLVGKAQGVPRGKATGEFEYYYVHQGNDEQRKLKIVVAISWFQCKPKEERIVLGSSLLR